ncbi:MAG: hypothetical protein INR68_08920 [Methylobacterium mesophilicum]|nr:hypothetical protein [Methylobacterium mesophilicum]
MRTASSVLDDLNAMAPMRTSDLPCDQRGIYALIDHLGRIFYLGSTAATNESFRKRIHQRHRTGTETYSHHFASAYNVGRMWRDPKARSVDEIADGVIAKRFRNAFIAEYCRAAYVPLQLEKAALFRLEAEVIALAPPAMRARNGRKLAPYAEPRELVDAFIKLSRLTEEDEAALHRQEQRFHRSLAAANVR